MLGIFIFRNISFSFCWGLQKFRVEGSIPFFRSNEKMKKLGLGLGLPGGG